MRCSDPKPPERPILAFAQDAVGDWVALLACGHRQHVRHNPPWMNRPWIETEEGRRAHVGQVLKCVRCLEEKSGGAC